MAMISYPMQASQRSDCILALFPQKQGCILNPLKQGSSLYPTAGTVESDNWAIKYNLLDMFNAEVAPTGFQSIFTQEEHESHFGNNYKQYVVFPNTTLDLRGNTTSKTFIGKMLRPSDLSGTPKTNGNSRNMANLFSAGNSTGSIDLINSIMRLGVASTRIDTTVPEIKEHYCCASVVFEDLYSAAYSDRHILEASYKMPDDWFDKFIVYAMVVDHDSTPGSVQIRLYIDGNLCATSELLQAKTWSQTTNPGSNVAPKESQYFSVAMRAENLIGAATFNIVAWGLIFDSVLSEEEIKKFK